MEKSQSLSPRSSAYVLYTDEQNSRVMHTAESRRQGLWDTDEPKRLVWLISVGAVPDGLWAINIWREEAMVDILCTCYPQLHTDQREALLCLWASPRQRLAISMGLRLWGSWQGHVCVNSTHSLRISLAPYSDPKWKVCWHFSETINIASIH